MQRRRDDLAGQRGYTQQNAAKGKTLVRVRGGKDARVCLE